MSSKELLYAIAEDRENETGERSFELDRGIDHRGGENLDEILDLLAQLGC